MADMNPQLIEQYTSALQDVFAGGGEAASFHAQEHSDALLRHLNEVLERQVAERTHELQRERDLAESLIETAQVIVLLLDLDGRIVRFNPYMEHISGYRLEEVRGEDWFTTFLPTRKQDGTRSVFLEAIHNGQTRGNVTPIVTKDGHEREIEWSDKTLKDANGQVAGLLAVGQDITERRRAEDAVRRNEAWLRSLIHVTQDAVVSIDRDGCIVLFNAAAERIFGYTRAEVEGQKVNMLMAEPYASEHDSYIERYERTGEPRALGRTRTVAARRKSGEVFPIELSVAEVRAGEGVRYGAFIRDISEKVRLQEQVLERERLAAIGTTAAIFAHEVGNPLNSMSLAAQLLERRLARHRNLVDDGFTAPLRNIMGELRRLTLLLEEFRTLARRQTLARKPIHLATLVADILAAEAPHYDPCGIRLVQELSTDLPVVAADSEKLKQVLLNLCKNAVEAMPQGGVLTVRAFNTGDLVHLEVSDTGVGIPSGIDIFEPFITTKAQGTGLGLTITRQIIAAHQGTLTYRSDPGQGTTFTLTLPVAQKAERIED